MEARITRRALAGLALALRAPAASRAVGIMCNLPPDEKRARDVLGAAQRAGFRTIQVNFPWDRVSDNFVRDLPRWISESRLTTQVLSAYVNCASPDNVIMSTRAADFDRAIETAPAFGAKRLVAWTGGYGPDLMTADERNFAKGSSDAICRFLEGRLKRLESARLTLALETYITLVCPDARSMKALLARLPPFVTAVLDPPNLTPVSRFATRDAVMHEMIKLLEGRIGVVHLKDFRLRSDGKGYDLPGPLGGEMNYTLLASLTRGVPQSVPFIAEHVSPAEFDATRERLAPLFGGA